MNPAELLRNSAHGFVVAQSCALFSVFSVRTSAIILTLVRLAQENAPQPYHIHMVAEHGDNGRACLSSRAAGHQYDG